MIKNYKYYDGYKAWRDIYPKRSFLPDPLPVVVVVIVVIKLVAILFSA